ncbi:maltooligosyl trehalose hydrolase [Variovorax sp. OV329]|nr:maltooligosyl trehalose hydrolase [Variovorax sp. OV329]
MPFGAELQDGGGVRFALWAPGASMPVLEHRPAGSDSWRAAALPAIGDGWYELVLPDAAAGDDYRFRVTEELAVPDPASRANPQDVHGPSRVVDPQAYEWQDAHWHGRPWHEAVVYELHVGTFTPEGSFAAARERLPELAALGITAVELMPLADFAGRRGWGYDGVLHFAPDASYGTPEDLKHFVDTAHGLGLMVLIDVVYNHFGPDGNYLHAYCPDFFDAATPTPWGAAINFDGAGSGPVRSFFVHNALYWIEEFRFDGLRMDAVHAISDRSRPAIVEEICLALQQGPGRSRQVHVVLENDRNESHRLTRDEQGRARTATAQWNDDLHHAAHAFLTGEKDGYYIDFADDALARFALALARGFVYAGEPSAFRQGQLRGEPCEDLPLAAFVSYLQTHDQVGNRALGDRIDRLADPRLVQAARACVLLSPHVPMLFMGEEYAALTPFLYFCDYGETPLGRAVTEGRRTEFAGFAAFAGNSPEVQVPDPNADATFDAAKLDWQERELPAHAAVLRQVRELLSARRQRLVPHLARGSRGLRHEVDGDGVLSVSWTVDGGRAQLHLLANFGQAGQTLPRPPGQVVHSLHVAAKDNGSRKLLLERGGVFASLEEPRDD